MQLLIFLLIYGGSLLLGALLLVYCVGSAYHYAPGDPKPTLGRFLRELYELILNED